MRNFVSCSGYNRNVISQKSTFRKTILGEIQERQDTGLGKDMHKEKGTGKILKRRNENRRYAISSGVLAILLLVLLVVSVNTGSVSVPVRQIWSILTGKVSESTATTIIWNIRLPRVVTAILLGGALSVSGFLLQTFFHNPIAGPFVLGISSGAKLVVALVMVFCVERGMAVGSFGMMAAAFVGSLASMGFVLLVAGKVRSMSILVICGVMVGYICTAITEFIVAFADDSNIVNLHNWSVGSFSGMSWSHVKTMFLVIGITMVVTFLLSKPIGAYQMGEAYARNMGVNVKAFRVLLILLSSILSACVTAFAGPVSFVGIAVPHLAKVLFKTAKPIVMIPACFLGGAVFCLFCDMIARTAFAPTELSISSVTALFGAPIVIYMMLKKHGNGEAHV